MYERQRVNCESYVIHVVQIVFISRVVVCWSLELEEKHVHNSFLCINCENCTTWSYSSHSGRGVPFCSCRFRTDQMQHQQPCRSFLLASSLFWPGPHALGHWSCCRRSSSPQRQTNEIFQNSAHSYIRINGFVFMINSCKLFTRDYSIMYYLCKFSHTDTTV